MLPLFSKDLDPAHGLWRPLLRQLDEMFDQQQTRTARDGGDVRRSDFSPNFELDETDNHYVMTFEVPGIRREDLSIEMNGNRLVVSGERKSDGRNGSRQYGKFQKLFTLPEGSSAEGIVAEHKDGLLRLAIPKPEAAKAVKIKINDGAAQVRNGGFFKNLVGEKKPKDTVIVSGATAKDESVTAH